MDGKRGGVRRHDADRSRLHALAVRLRAVAVDVLPRYVRPWGQSSPPRDPLAGLCGFAAVGVVNAAAELGYTGGVVNGYRYPGTHLWARFDCGLDVDITGPQFGLPPVLVMNRTEARRHGFRLRANDRDRFMRPGEYDVRQYARRYGCHRFPVEWWRVAVGESEAA